MNVRGLLLVAVAFGLTCAAPTRAQWPGGKTEAVSSATPAAGNASVPAGRGEDKPAARDPRGLPPEKAQPLTVKRFAEAPSVDGRLDEAVWESATVLNGFYQTQPGDNTSPTEQTEVRLGYDAEHLYLGIRAQDKLGNVRATVAKRDNVVEDDNVQIYLDTFNDRRRAYVLIFNPLGVQQDGIFTEGQGEDYSFDLLMESRGAVHDGGYTIEVAIPFKSLRYQSGGGRLWGIHVFRRIKHRNDEQNSWMPLARGVSGLLNQAGHLAGLEDIAPGRTLELIPSLTISETGRRRATLSPAELDRRPGALDPGRFVNAPVELDPGLTAKLGITPTVTLDLAVNPDFAQVEADQTVVTANQRFPIFFQEKRPFFLEGIDIFQTPLTPVHTRTIIDPDVAVKLTGKLGRNTFGLLAASDRGPGDFRGDERLDPRNFRFLDKNAFVGVLRLKRDIGKENSLGLIATTYNFIEKHNDVGGLDGRFRLGQQTTLTFQALGTTSRRFFFDPGLGRRVYRTGNGFGYTYSYDTKGRNVSYALTGSGYTRDYRADVGFTRRLNTNREDFVFSYHSTPKPGARLISYTVTSGAGVNFDFQGRMQGWNNNHQFGVNLPRQTSLAFGFVGGFERLFEEEFGPRRGPALAGAFAGPDAERSAYNQTFFFFGQTTPTKQLSASFSLDYGRGVFDFDFGGGPRFPRVSPAALADPAAALDPGPGDGLTFLSFLSYQPTPALLTSLGYTKSRLVRRDTGRVAFDENIYVWRTTYQFTRFTFARARVDYNSLESNFRGQFLVGWAPNPGTALYVGYNDDLNRNGFNPFTGQHEPGFRRNGRTFFIKMSYLLRRGR